MSRPRWRSALPSHAILRKTKRKEDEVILSSQIWLSVEKSEPGCFYQNGSKGLRADRSPLTPRGYRE
jgi:hypothetical protein